MSVPLPAISISPNVPVNVNLTMPPQNIRALLITNKSPYDCQVSGVSTREVKWLTAGTENLFIANGKDGIDGIKGNVQLIPFNNINLANPPLSPVLITVYKTEDALPKGSWPVSVPFQTVFTQTQVLSNQLKNDGNAAATQIIESTVSGDVASAVTLTNDALMVLGDTAHPGSLTLLGPINPNMPGSSISGSTQGTLTVYQWVQGTVKYAVFFFNNFQNGSASVQTLALPTPFISYTLFRSGEIPEVAFLSSGVQQGIEVVTGFPSTGTPNTGGSVSNPSNNRFGRWSLGDTGFGWDTLQVSANNSSAHFGILECRGI